MTDGTEYGRASGKQAQKKRKRAFQRNRTTAHQSKREEFGYEFQEYIFMLVTEENDKIFGGGMDEGRDVNSNMTVYVRIITSKTISIKCDRRHTIARIMDEVERQTLIPKDFHDLANQGGSTWTRKL